MSILLKSPHGRTRLCFFARSSSASAYTCAAQYANWQSDDDEAEDLASCSELQQRMRWHASSGNIMEALKTLNLMNNIPGKPSVYEYNSIITCYCKSQNVVLDELFYKVYKRMKEYGPLPNLETYKCLLSGMLSLGHTKEAMFIFKEMVADGFYPSYTIFEKLFKKLLKAGLLEDSLEVLERFKYDPTDHDLGGLIRGLCKAGTVQKGHVVFSKRAEMGYYVPGIVFNPILWALCKSSQIDKALSFFGWLKKKGFYLDVCSYTALLYGFSKEKLRREACHCLDEINAADFQPSLETCTVIVKFLCDDGKVDDAYKHLQKMEAIGCNPDLVTYNIILRELCHQDREAEIDDLLHVIGRKGLRGDACTLAAVAGGILKAGKVEMANKLLLDTISRGCCLDVVVNNIYLHSICHLLGSGEALSELQHMVERGVTPSDASYNTILNGLCKENNTEAALMLFKRIRWPTVAFNLISFNTILSAACKSCDASMIWLVWRIWVQCGGIKPNVVSWTCLLEYYCRIGEIPECLNHLESMMKNGPLPNIITLNTLLVGLYRNRLFGKAKRIFNDFKCFGISPNTTTYNIIMSSCIREGNAFQVHELWRDMFSQKVVPDVRTYALYIDSLCRKGKISRALQLLNWMLENGIPPNVFIYNKIMGAMLRKRLFRKSILVYKDMIIYGCEPNEISFNLLRQAQNRLNEEFPQKRKLLEFVMRGGLQTANTRRADEQDQKAYVIHNQTI